MIVKCVKNTLTNNTLLLGKTYEVVKFEKDDNNLEYYFIKGEDGQIREYFAERFAIVKGDEKVRCVDVKGVSRYELTLGKDYTLLGEYTTEGGNIYYKVKNDQGREFEYFSERFEKVDEVALAIDELELPEDFMDEIKGLELIKEDLKKEEVKSMRSLRERVLGKVNYKSIAEQIWNRLENEIIDEISYSLDEDSIVDDMIYHYKSDYIDVAKEVLIEEIFQDISSDEIEDHIKEIARGKAYE